MYGPIRFLSRRGNVGRLARIALLIVLPWWQSCSSLEQVSEAPGSPPPRSAALLEEKKESSSHALSDADLHPELLPFFEDLRHILSLPSFEMLFPDLSDEERQWLETERRRNHRATRLLLHAHQGQWQEALAEAESWVRTEPGSVPAASVWSDLARYLPPADVDEPGAAPAGPTRESLVQTQLDLAHRPEQVALRCLMLDKFPGVERFKAALALLDTAPLHEACLDSLSRVLVDAADDLAGGDRVTLARHLEAAIQVEPLNPTEWARTLPAAFIETRRLLAQGRAPEAEPLVRGWMLRPLGAHSLVATYAQLRVGSHRPSALLKSAIEADTVLRMATGRMPYPVAQAMDLMMRGEVPLAVELLRCTLRYCRKVSVPGDCAHVLRYLGLALRHQGRTEEALSVLEEALRDDARGDGEIEPLILLTLAQCHRDLGAQNRALEILYRLLESEQRRHDTQDKLRTLDKSGFELTVRNALARIQMARGDYPTAVRLLSEWVATAERRRQLLPPDLVLWGELCAHVGEIACALEKLEQGIDEYRNRDTYGPISSALLQRAELFIRLGRLDWARESMLEAEAAAARGGQTSDSGASHLIWARWYQEQGDLDSAIVSLERAGRHENASGQGTALLRTRLLQARLLLELKALDRAGTLLHGLLSSVREHQALWLEAEVYAALGDHAWKEGDAARAERWLEQAYDAAVAWGEPTLIHFALSRRAALAHGNGQNSRALLLGEDALSRGKELLDRIGHEALESSHFAKFDALYQLLIQLYAQPDAQSTPAVRENALNLAFQRSEERHALLLLRRIAGTTQPSERDREHAHLTAEEEARVSLQRVMRFQASPFSEEERLMHLGMLTRTPLPVEYDGALKWRTALERGELPTAGRLELLRAASDHWSRRLLAARDEHRAGSGDERVTIIGLKELQERLLDSEHLVSYVVGPDRSLGFHVSRHGVSVFEVAGSAQLHPDIQRFQEGVSQTQAQEAATAGRRLADALLRPWIGDLEKGDRVILIADGALGQLSFELLPVPDASETTSSRGPVLIERHPISYTFSATHWAAAARDCRRIPSGPALLVGDPVYLEDRCNDKVVTLAGGPKSRALALGERWTRLCHSGAEVKAVAAALDPASWGGCGAASSRQLTGGRASEPEFRALVDRRFKRLHFAVHGLSDLRSGLRSALVLSQDPAVMEYEPGLQSPKREGDGYLDVAEIASLPLDADLVVLSACETLRGPARLGEGVASLARAFMEAGARQVLASRWKVEDECTRVLMERFYLHLQRLPASEALRETVQEFANGDHGELWRHPRFWGGFSLTVGGRGGGARRGG